MTKIIFFDIDGTILPLGETEIRPKVKEALIQLHEKGILLFLATGRAPFVVPKFDDIPFDGLLAYNGSYCRNKEGIIYTKPLDSKDIQTVVQNAKEMGKPVQLATDIRMGANFYDQNLADYFNIANQPADILEDYDVALTEDIYQLMVPVVDCEEEALMKNVTSLKCTRWWDRACDVISIDGGKSQGIQHILDFYQIDQQDAMAFGDGGNDADMIEYAGIGIAMENGTEAAKAVADYITDSVEKDGVYTALQHYHLL